jgi:hypothetical protein
MVQNYDKNSKRTLYNKLIKVKSDVFLSILYSKVDNITCFSLIFCNFAAV